MPAGVCLARGFDVIVVGGALHDALERDVVSRLRTDVEHAQAGTDGLPLSDYDLIGSASSGTGLFALHQVEHFDLLYLPPPEQRRVPGPAAVLAAELYCRKRAAMLILDACPPAAVVPTR